MREELHGVCFCFLSLFPSTVSWLLWNSIMYTNLYVLQDLFWPPCPAQQCCFTFGVAHNFVEWWESHRSVYCVCWLLLCGGLIGSRTGRDKIHFDLYFLITRSLWEVCFQTQTYSSALLHSPFSLRKFSNQDWDFNLY